MASPSTILTKQIHAVHGARPDFRLWRNETAGVWAGKFMARLGNGDTVLRGARFFKCGLWTGSSDLIGITDEGRFLSLEIKTGKDTPSDEQKAWLAFIERMGGIQAVIRSVQDVTDLLGEPK